MKYLSLLILIVVLNSAYCQDNLSSIVTKETAKPYQEIVDDIESYFTKKHPQLRKSQLGAGEFRDSEYVKYMRWRTFWDGRINEDGMMADLTKRAKSYENVTSQRSDHLYENTQWENISYGQDLGFQIGLGRTNSMAFHPTDPDIFYVAAAFGGVWKTEDGGLSYTALGDELPFLSVSCIIVDQADPETIYISTGDRVWYGPPSSGILKSTDGGQTWQETSFSFSFTQNRRIYWMEADPNNSKIMYLASSFGLYKTIDGFETTDFVRSGVYTDVKFKPESSDVIYLGRVDPNRLVRSTDGGETFESIYDLNGNQYTRVVTTSLDPEIVMASSSNNLYRFQQSGDEFLELANLQPADTGNGIVMISPQNPDKIYTGWFDLYESSGDFNSQDAISDWFGGYGLPVVHVDYRNAFINPLQPDFIYLCNDGGVYRLDVNTNQFTNLSNGLIITQFYDIAVSQTDPSTISGGSQDNGNVYMSDYVWRRAAPSGDGMTQAINPLDETVRYFSYQNGAIEKVTGNSIENISGYIDPFFEDPEDIFVQGEWVTPFVLDPNDPNTIVAAYEIVYRSHDGGFSWERISESLSGRDLDLLAIAPSNSERIYVVENWGAGTGDLYGFNHDVSRLYVKDTNSNDWETTSLPVTTNVEEILVDPNDADHVFICCSGYSSVNKIYESFDAGQTWDKITYDIPNAPAMAMAFYTYGGTDYLFVGTDAGIYYKSLAEETWHSMGSFPNTYVTDMEIQYEEELIRVGTHGRGVFQASLVPELTSVKDGLEQAEDCLIVYPVPSKDFIKIETEVDEFLVHIVDVQGKVVRSSRSQYMIDLDVPSGIYFCLIKDIVSGTTLCSQKFVVEK